jgi:hypothetical protein
MVINIWGIIIIIIHYDTTNDFSLVAKTQDHVPNIR